MVEIIACKKNIGEDLRNEKKNYKPQTIKW